ncbi:MAG: hypothetical protein GF329_04820 [Candidatus Lokiarchaeota archaeon]|nr:hypothetical protein [Candidatus Lokiarchaeota archaeon]
MIYSNNFITDGFRYKCARCASCCRDWDGIIYVSIYEVKNIADNLNLTLEEVFKDFIHMEEQTVDYGGESIELTYLAINQVDNHCVFLDENDNCIIHEYKPFLCKIYPFWSIIMEKSDNFEEYSQKCKGFNNQDGPLYNKEDIEEILKSEEDYLENLNRVALIMNSIDETEILAIMMERMDLNSRIDEDALELLRNNLVIKKIQILINQNS